MESLLVFHLLIAMLGGVLGMALMVWLIYLYAMLRDRNHSTKENGLS